MFEEHKQIQHFILTRFNLFLWNKDKEGGKVRTKKWLEHRFALFEQFCFPSIRSQTCQAYEWIVLFDSMTPDSFKERIVQFQEECPQLTPVYVKPADGNHFIEIFKAEIVKRLRGDRVITTYLDNDDALNVRFLEDLQQRVATINDDTFIYYDDGYQLYIDYNYMMEICFPRNHFVSYVEKGDPATVKSVFCYGTHYYIYTIKGAKIEHVKGQRMWCEVIHEKNMLNDAYFLNAKMTRNDDLLRRDFAIDETVQYGLGIYVFSFLPRYLKTLGRRTKRFLFGKSYNFSKTFV